LSEALVNLIIADHAYLALRSRSHRDPADPTYDMSMPPATYDEAMRRADAGCWKATMDKEMQLMHDMHVYELVPLPLG
jgi:hypothetical protein